MEKYKEQFIKATSPLFLTPKCQFNRTFPNTNPRLQDQIQDFPFRELGYNPTYQAPNGLAFMVFCFCYLAESLLSLTPLTLKSLLFS